MSTISVRLPSRPVEGCTQRAVGVLRSKELGREEVELRWRWLRGAAVVPNCAYEGCNFAYEYDPVSVSQRGTALQCAACLKSQLPRETYTFCSAACFVRAWPAHKAKHGDKVCVERARANSESDDSGKLRTNGHDESHEWVVIAEGPAELVPTSDDVGRRLRVECVGYARSRQSDSMDGCVARGVHVTEPVLAAPGPVAERRWFGELPRTGDDDSARIRVASYNVLAEIYCTQQMYPYCAKWALDWQYRARRVVDEIAEADPDVLCLQEAQRDHFERDLEPALDARGYEGIFAQKSREAMGHAGKVDGCALFWKKSKFRLAEHRTLAFNDVARAEAAALSLSGLNEHAFLLRLVKGNVAQIAVLEAFGGTSRGPPRRLCVANTHLYSNKDFPDTKLWQTLTLVRELDRLFHARSHRDQRRSDLPLIFAGDFNSSPHSAVYQLLATGSVDPNHPDLAPPPGRRGPSILPNDTRDISHRLHLASAYRTATGAEPLFTDYTLGFQGTLDYLWHDPDTLRCAAVAQIPEVHELTAAGDALPNAQYPSDHVMLIADFVFQPHNSFAPGRLSMLANAA